jgi:hypothetical protein
MDFISVFWTIVLLFFWSAIIILVALIAWVALEKLNSD